MSVDYGPGDMVVSIYSRKRSPHAPERPVMVCSVGEPSNSNFFCAVHGKRCGPLRVTFVDWPEPPFDYCIWTACAFRKVPTTDDRVEAERADDLMEPAR